MHRLSILLILFVLGGCNSISRKPIADDPFYAPVYPEAPMTKMETTGAIFQASQANSLYSDLRAHKVGDIITVMLSESTQASKSVNNAIKKGSSMTLSPVTAGGGNVTIKGLPIDLNYQDNMDTSRNSAANQSNSLSGSISANVMRVLDNGNLLIRGEKWITINKGEEFIRLTGIVRSQDINPDNTVASTRVANARIQYSGTGTFADSQEVGWLGKFFFSDWWPF